MKTHQGMWPPPAAKPSGPGAPAANQAAAGNQVKWHQLPVNAAKAGGRALAYTVRNKRLPVATKPHAEARGKVCAGDGNTPPCPYWDSKARAVIPQAIREAFGLPEVNLGKCTHPKCGCTKVKWYDLAETCPDKTDARPGGRWVEVDRAFSEG